MQAPNGPSKRVHTGKPLSKRILENWQMYLFLLIPMVWLIVFKYWPMYGVTIAFKKYAPKAGILGSPWVGFEYLVRFFQSYQFNRTVFNTVYLSMMSMIITFPIPIIFLREILMLNAFDSEAAGALADELMNNQSLQDLLKYGLIVISSAPILILYPFVKKYFMKGVMIGAVKG